MRPDFQILADGKDATAQFRDRLINMKVTDKAGVESDEVEVTLDDRDGAITLPRRGVTIDVSLGYRETGLSRIGKYKIDEVESSGPPQQIVIRGRPADMSGGLKTARKHSWENTTLDQVVRTVASRNKLTPVCSVKASIDRLDQMNESDLHFITRIARQYDATASIKGGKLLVLPRGGQAKSASGKKLPVIVLTRKDIKSWRWSASDRDASGGVKVKTHNPKTGNPLATLIPDKTNPNGPVRVVRHPVPAKGRAAATAKGALDRGNRSTITLSLTLPGRADLVAERQVRVSGIKSGVDGLYPIESVTHDYSAGGWSTSAELGVSKETLKKSRAKKGKKKKAEKPSKVLAP